MRKKDDQPSLVIRKARPTDIPEICDLCVRVYSEDFAYHPAEIRGQINHFPEGQFVAVYEDKVVGYCASIIVTEQQALSTHTWQSITGGGYCTTHKARGDYLYGVDVFIDPAYRRLRIGERFYTERKNLCKYLRLKGIAFAGRMPHLKKRFKKVGSAEAYLQQVLDKKIRDPVINFQVREGFTPLRILHGYLPTDADSMGCAVQMVWHNPEATAHEATAVDSNRHTSSSVRVAAVQYKQRQISSWEEFVQIVTYFVDVVSEYHSDFVLFPEMFTFQLLSIDNDKQASEQDVLKLTEYTERFKKVFTELAVKYNVNIIAGSHPVKIGDEVNNVSFIFLRDGSIHEQPKIHPTPDEKYWWNVTGGNHLTPIDTDCGTIGVLICYDAEFPELARHLVDQGANILFVPFCTSERQGYLRVRYCAHARAVENQCYVVLAGNVGNLPTVKNMDIQYGQASVLTPCDFAFARDGIAAEGNPNVEAVIFADLRLDSLYESRLSGTVVNFSDRRHDLFRVVWQKKH